MEWSNKSRREEPEECLFLHEVQKEEEKWEALKIRYSDQGEGIWRWKDQNESWSATEMGADFQGEVDI